MSQFDSKATLLAFNCCNARAPSEVSRRLSQHVASINLQICPFGAQIRVKPEARAAGHAAAGAASKRVNSSRAPDDNPSLIDVASLS
jgi:hypothetical protein